MCSAFRERDGEDGGIARQKCMFGYVGKKICLVISFSLGILISICACDVPARKVNESAERDAAWKFAGGKKDVADFVSLG